MDYATLNSYLQNLIQDQGPSADYTAILPAAIQDAEQRIYRELDFVAARTVNSGSALTAGSRTFTLPTSPSTILVLQGVSVVTPAGSSPSTGTRVPLEPASLDYIDCTWTNEATTGVPDTWALKDSSTIVVKPTPAAAYTVELTGIFRPAPLSASNTTTYISLTYPDLLVAACMLFLFAWQRDFSPSADMPQAAISWERHYQGLKQSALLEEQRRQGSGMGWSPFMPTPIAQPQRS